MRMLATKKYYFLIEANKSCQVSFTARWVYSFLVFRASLSKPASGACIVRNCGLSNRGSKKYLSELRKANLLAEREGYYLAREPSSECWPWFITKGNASLLPWFHRFASFAVYVPNPHQGLPLSHSAMLSLVWSLRHGSGWITIRPSALATMLFPDMNRTSAKRQVNRAAKNLREKGLLDDSWNVTIEETHHHYWRDADQLVNPRSRSDVEMESLREYVLACLGDRASEHFFRSRFELGMRLEQHEHVMRHAGYNQRQILEYWRDVIYEGSYCGKRALMLEAFIARGFTPVFKAAEEMTAENRIARSYVGISLGLLRRLTQYECLTLNQMYGKKNSNGEWLLMYYEPDHDRMKVKAV
jgi:hypothetical protein